MENFNFTLVLVSYVMSVIGSFMALYITRSARLHGQIRINLLVLASLCLGGVGIWSMHFISMLGFHPHEMSINFNWPLTIFSFFVGVAGVYMGLYTMCQSEMKIQKLLFAGYMVGTSVAVMHYTGMFAMKMQADVVWNWTMVAVSCVIAVVASAVALWLAVKVDKMWQILCSAFVMGAAICGMHYTGMAAATFIPNTFLPFVEPLETTSFFFTTVIVVVNVAIILFGMVVTMAESNRRKTKFKYSVESR